MSIKDNVKPTRSELIELKRRITLSEGRHKLLKMKRDGLIMEFFEILDKAKNVRSELDEEHKLAKEKIGIAMAVDGEITVRSTAFALKGSSEIVLRSKNIMGVVVPEIESSLSLIHI